jgi:hypothetical protein
VGRSSNPTTSSRIRDPEGRGTATVARDGGDVPKYVEYTALAGMKRDIEGKRRVMWDVWRGRDKPGVVNVAEC